MYVSKVSLKNWKNFTDVNVSLDDRVFVVGPNASGKSNFLDAIRFLRDVARDGGGLQKAIDDRSGLSKIRCLSARQYPDVVIDVELSDFQTRKVEWRYRLGIKQDVRGNRKALVAYEEVWKKGRKVLSRPDEYDKKDSLRLTQTHLEQINANSAFRAVAQVFRSVRYLHPVPQLMRRPDDFRASRKGEDFFGLSFIDLVVNTPENYRRSRLKRIEKALRLAVPQLKQFELVTDSKGIPHLQAVYDHWRPKGAKQQEEQFSDGTLRLIGLLWSLLDGDSILLLEEPELSLHRAIVAQIPQLIHQIQKQKKRQVIVSTHSFDLLSDKSIGGEEVLLLQPSKEGTSVNNVSEKRDVFQILKNGISVADVVLPLTAPRRISQMELFKAKK